MERTGGHATCLPFPGKLVSLLDFNCFQDVGGKRGMHMPVGEAKNNTQRFFGRKRPADFLSYGDVKLLEHLHAEATAPGFPKAGNQPFCPGMLFAGRFIVRIN